MSATLGDLITDITNSLNGGVTSNYCAKGTVQPGIPTPVNPSMPLSAATATDIQNAVTYATYSKWRTETGGSHALRIKGAEMVKTVTGLEPIEPEQKGR